MNNQGIEKLIGYLQKQVKIKITGLCKNIQQLIERKLDEIQCIISKLETCKFNNQKIQQFGKKIAQINFNGIMQKLNQQLDLIKKIDPQIQEQSINNEQNMKQTTQQNQKVQKLGKKQQKQKQPIKKKSKNINKINLDYLNKQEFKIQDVETEFELRVPEQITHISINNKLSGMQLLKIFQNKSLINLEYLALQNNSLQNLGQLPKIRFRKLAYLYLANNKISKNISTLQSLNCKNLTHLSLTNNKLGPQQIFDFGEKFQKLRYLNLKNNNILCKGGFKIFNSTMVNLQYLHLQNCGIQSNSLIPIAFTKNYETKFPRLIHLHISNNKIQNKGLQYIVKSRLFLQLKLLAVQKIGINDQSMNIFQENQNPQELKIDTLDLSSNNLTDQGIKILAKNKFKNLVRLVLKNNNLSTDSIKFLSKVSMPIFRNLQIQNNPMINPESYQIKNLAYTFTQKLYQKVFINA